MLEIRLSEPKESQGCSAWISVGGDHLQCSRPCGHGDGHSYFAMNAQGIIEDPITGTKYPKVSLTVTWEVRVGPSESPK